MSGQAIESVPPTVPMFDRTRGRIGTAHDLWRLAQQARDWYRKRSTYTVTVPENDPLFREVRDWVSAHVVPTNRRALVARLSDQPQHPSGPMVDVMPGESAPETLNVSVGDNANYTLTLGGHQIRATTVPTTFGTDYRTIPGGISLTAPSFDGQQAILTHLRALAEQRRSAPRRPDLIIMDRYGSWTTTGSLPTRELDTVALAGGQLDRIVGDLDRFLTSEDVYARRGLPWHRGYLFEGPPGTGKTSLAKALAGHFGLDIWYAPLGDLDKDAKLLNLVAQIRCRGVLLLEDVDVFATTHSRDAEQGAASLSGLLNALDGVATPHGLITILTTNNASVLDEALTRAGRIDMREHLGMPDAEQAGRVFANFYGTTPTPLASLGGLSPADIVEVCKQHESDWETALDVLGTESARRAALPIVVQGSLIDKDAVRERLGVRKPLALVTET